MKIRKAIIPAAGFGTRFLPVTKAVPKEMLPVGDRPVIDYVVEEAAHAGIEEILIVISRGKETIANYFSRDLELERRLEASGKGELAARLRRISEMARIQYVYQHEMKGLGDAVLCGSSFVGEEPFAVLLGDTVVTQGSGGAAGMPLPRMIGACQGHRKSVVAIEPVPVERVSRYGIVGGEEVESDIFRLEQLVEKPNPGEAPRMRRAASAGGGEEDAFFAFAGRYLFTPRLFDCLRETPPGKNNEVQLTDAMQRLLRAEGMYAVRSRAIRHDIGSPDGLFRLLAHLGAGQLAAGAGRVGEPADLDGSARL
jgi:UTP--glucose-1-phosphate uridylyltransferase